MFFFVLCVCILKFKFKKFKDSIDFSVLISVFSRIVNYFVIGKKIEIWLYKI